MEAMKREVQRYSNNSCNLFFTLLPDKYKNDHCRKPSLSWAVNRRQSQTAGRSTKELTKRSIREFDLTDICWVKEFF